MVAKVAVPFPTFMDTSGQPLDGGYIYIGEPNQNPQTSPASVYWDAAGTIPAAQPLRTSNGFLFRNGTPANVYVADDFSLTVRTSSGTLVYSRLSGNLYIGSAAQLTFSQDDTYPEGTVGERLKTEVFVTDDPYNADPTGTTDSATAINQAWEDLPDGGTLVIPPGTFKLASDFLLAYSGVNGSNKTLDMRGCTLTAGANNVKLIHWSDSYCNMIGSVRFTSGSYTGVSALRITPEDETQTSAVVNQNYNKISAAMEFGGVDESIVLQTGPRVAGTDSGCWYNQITGPMHFTSVKRCAWLKDASQVADGRSGCNSNVFGPMVMNGSINTGIQIDAGGGNIFYVPQFENITNGTSPNSTPVGLKVANTMTNGGSNNDNTFYSPHWENCTTNASISNASTKLYTTETEIFNSSGQITPYWDQWNDVLVEKGTLLNGIYGIVTSGSNIRALWLFDAYGATSEVLDRSPYGHHVTLRNAALATQNANQWGPRISALAQGLTYGDESHLWDTANNADFNFGNGATDSAFSIVSLCYPTLAVDCEIFAKDNVTTGTTAREYALSVNTNGSISGLCFDNSTAGSVGRSAPAGSVTASAIQVVTMTYDGSSTNAGVKLYVNASEVDSANAGSGSYTAMEALTTKPAGYRIGTAGTPERVYRGRLFVTLVVAETLTALQIRRLSNLLRSYAGASV